MKINSVLDKAIKILTVCVISIMLTICVLFVIPPNYVYADSFESQPLSTGDSLPVYESSGNTRSIYIVEGTDVYVFFLNDATNNSGPSFYLASPFQQTVKYRRADQSGLVTITLSQNSNNLYYNQGDGTFSWGTSGTTYLLPFYDTVDSALASIESSLQTGEFLSLPQDSYSSTFDFDTIKTFGVWIYSGYNVYSLYGSYNSIVSPTSQYCYIDNGDDSYSCAVFSSVPLTVYSAFINGETYTYFVCSQYDVGKYCYVFNQNVDISGLSVQPFDSLESAQSAFSGASSGGGGGSAAGVTSAGALSIDVPAGNVLYVRVRSGSLASVTATVPVISSTSSPYWLSSQINTQWVSGVSDLPNENTQFPLSGMSVISFSPDKSKGLDGYGRSFYAKANHAPFNSGWFVVYNPTYTNTPISGRTDLMTVNPTVTVNCQYALSYQLFDLHETLTVDGGTSSNSSGYDNPWSGQYDDVNNSWSNTSQRTDNPQSGGEQADVVSQNNMSIGEQLTQIWSTLNDFVNNFSSLLAAPISHIQSLIAAGSAFMTSISLFFVWLPAPVYSILITALILVIVIGVIKLLFK